MGSRANEKPRMKMFDWMKKRINVQSEKDLSDFATEINGRGTSQDLSTVGIYHDTREIVFQYKQIFLITLGSSFNCDHAGILSSTVELIISIPTYIFIDLRRMNIDLDGN